MRKAVIFTTLVLVVLSSSATNLDYSLLASKHHPRVMIDSAGFADIRYKINQDSIHNRFLCDVTRKIVSYAEKFVEAPRDITFTLDESGVRLLAQSRDALLQLTYLAYAYQITGESRFLERGRKMLSDICSFKSWNPSHFLDVAEMCLGVSIAYDWMYYGLTDSERSLIEQRIVDYALIPGQKGWFYEVANNWNQVCAAGLVAGSIAVYDKSDSISRVTIEKCVESNRVVIEKIYSPDGNYPEGYVYWTYGSGFQGILMKLMQTAFNSLDGLDKIAGMDKTGEYMLFMSGIKGCFNHSDCSQDLCAAIGMWWFAYMNGDKSILSAEMKNYRNGLYDGIRELTLIPAIVKDMNVDSLADVVPSKNIWRGRGAVPIVLVHTGWKYDETDHYLGIKGGPTNSNHGHMDVGSFVYDALGERWSSDLPCPPYSLLEVELGKTGENYWDMGQRSGRWDVFELNSYAHSTITAWNNLCPERSHPTDFAVDKCGSFTNIIESESELGATMDMSEVIGGQVKSATRTITLVDEKDLVIVDKITADTTDVTMVWHMITPAQVSIEEDYERLTQNGKTMYLKTSGDARVEYIAEKFQRPSVWKPRTDIDNITSKSWNFNFSGYRFVVPAGKTVTMTTVLSASRPR